MPSSSLEELEQSVLAQFLQHSTHARHPPAHHLTAPGQQLRAHLLKNIVGNSADKKKS